MLHPPARENPPEHAPPVAAAHAPPRRALHPRLGTRAAPRSNQAALAQTQRGGAGRAAPSAVPPIVQAVLRAPGRPLDGRSRAFFEPSFGRDFGHVRIHTDALAAEAAHASGARAFTARNQIVFGRGQFSPHTAKGRWLLAHELAHVAQVRGGPSSSAAHLERDASRAATAVLRAETPILESRHDGTQLHRFGEPENVPEITYISTQGQAGFLQQAAEFHQAWGLSIQRVGSVEQMVNHLAQGSAPVNRIRFVTHSADIGVFTSLFTGEPLESLTQARLTAYAESDAAGLALDTEMALNVNLGLIVGEIRHTSPALLAPFGLQASGSPTGQLEAFFGRVLTLVALTQTRTQHNAAQFDPMIQALPTVIQHVASRVVPEFPGPPPVTLQNVVDLQPAIEAAVTALRMTFSGVSVPAAQAAHVREGLRATRAGFHGTLDTARGRFTSNSWVDIRGCNAGDDVAYLRAVSRFFGRAPGLPHVSGPDWFQVFPILGLRTVSTAEQIAAAGTGPGVAEAVGRWSPLTGARQQMELLRSFYRLEIARRETAAAESETASSGSLMPAQGPRLDISGLPRVNPLVPGLPATAEDRAAVDLLLLPMAPRLQLPESQLAPSFRPRLSLGSFRLTEPAVLIARAALDRLNAPQAELRYYLDSALVLPVFVGGNQQNFQLLVKSELMNEAIDGWLASQWSSAAPGLAALQAGPPGAANARRVQALVEAHDENAPPGAQMVFPPDPRFWQHIRQI